MNVIDIALGVFIGRVLYDGYEFVMLVLFGGDCDHEPIDEFRSEAPVEVKHAEPVDVAGPVKKTMHYHTRADGTKEPFYSIVEYPDGRRGIIDECPIDQCGTWYR